MPQYNLYDLHNSHKDNNKINTELKTTKGEDTALNYFAKSAYDNYNKVKDDLYVPNYAVTQINNMRPIGRTAQRKSNDVPNSSLGHGEMISTRDAIERFSHDEHLKNNNSPKDISQWLGGKNFYDNISSIKDFLNNKNATVKIWSQKKPCTKNMSVNIGNEQYENYNPSCDTVLDSILDTDDTVDYLSPIITNKHYGSERYDHDTTKKNSQLLKTLYDDINANSVRKIQLPHGQNALANASAFAKAIRDAKRREFQLTQREQLTQLKQHVQHEQLEKYRFNIPSNLKPLEPDYDYDYDYNNLNITPIMNTWRHDNNNYDKVNKFLNHQNYETYLQQLPKYRYKDLNKEGKELFHDDGGNGFSLSWGDKYKLTDGEIIKRRELEDALMFNNNILDDDDDDDDDGSYSINRLKLNDILKNPDKYNLKNGPPLPNSPVNRPANTMEPHAPQNTPEKLRYIDERSNYAKGGYITSPNTYMRDLIRRSKAVADSYM